MKKSECYKLAITHLIDSSIPTKELVEVLDLLYAEKQLAEMCERLDVEKE